MRRLRRRRALKAAIVAAGVALSVMVVSGAWAKDVTLVVDGRSQAVRTRSTSVEDLLTAQGLPLSIGLQVQPPPATTLTDGMTVIVSPPPGVPVRGFSLAFTSTGVGVWVVDRPETGPFGKAGFATEEVSTSAAGVGPPGVTVRVVVSGKVHDVSTNADTTGALLTAMGIQPDADDRVVPPPSTPLHDRMTIRFVRVSTFLRRAVFPIPAPVQTEYTSSMTPGNVQILQAGVPGVKEATLQVRWADGRVVSRRTIASRVLVAPVAEQRLSAPYSMSDGALTEPGTGASAQSGDATWYDPPWSGLTAAHPWLPFGTHVTVTDLGTGRSVTVVIDDRGPFGTGRIIDLSPEAFSQLEPLGRGVLHVGLTW
ncbi:MAG: ubiquitin-like domain-containing protein [Actinomycetota bacterium]|nr:ubiquitin-like domain-containing protein [Actinomycetota bacterium]